MPPAPGCCFACNRPPSPSSWMGLTTADRKGQESTTKSQCSAARAPEGSSPKRARQLGQNGALPYPLCVPIAPSSGASAGPRTRGTITAFSCTYIEGLRKDDGDGGSHFWFFAFARVIYYVLEELKWTGKVTKPSLVVSKKLKSLVCIVVQSTFRG